VLLELYFAFSEGGFFAGTTAVGALLLAGVLAVRMAVVRHPLVGIGRGLAIAVAGLVALTTWILLSSAWSHAPGRAVVEFDRALLYTLVLLAGGLFFSTPPRLALLLRALFIALLAVSVCALITRVAPDVWPVEPNLSNDRLSFPLTYWNGLGLLAAVTCLLGLHFASQAREPLLMRALGAAAVPVAAATLFFTFSRGAMAAGVVALVVYVVAARPPGALLAAVTAVPAAAIAVIAAYDADLLAAFDPTGPAAEAQGHHVALVVGACAVGAAVARAALAPLDARFARIRVPSQIARPAAAAVAIGLVGLAIGAGAPGWVATQFDRFVEGNRLEQTGDFRERLVSPANNGRLDNWRVAAEGFRDAPVLGNGAGSYEHEWSERRPNSTIVLDAHSLYLETLSELGIVGLVLLAIPLLAVLMACLGGLRGSQRPVFAAVLAVAVAWIVHAGVDWDWEMPAVSWWFFLLGGAALACARRSDVARAPAPLVRTVTVLGLAALAVTPALTAVSQARLGAATESAKAGDCDRAVDAGIAAARWMPPRAEAFEILGFCNLQLGASRLAITQMEAAVARDARNWRYRYGLALVRADEGLDPRPAARRAVSLNPRSAFARDGARRFRGATPRAWRRAARAAPWPSLP
jgi:O-antigen ligase